MPAIRRAFADLSMGRSTMPCGDTTAPPVLLLHQTPRSWTEYREVLPLLGQRYPRHRDGHAPASATPRRCPGRRASNAGRAAAVELLDALRIARAHVVGHHTGGVIALEIAAAFPIARRVAGAVVDALHR